MSSKIGRFLLSKNGMAVHAKRLLYGLGFLVKANGCLTLLGHPSVLCAKVTASPWAVRREEFQQLFARAFQTGEQSASVSPLTADEQACYAQEVEQGAETAAWAQLVLALRHWKGLGVTQDLVLAQSYAEKVEAFGNEPKAWVDLGWGMIALSEKQFGRAQTYLRQALSFGGEPGAWARLSLGELYALQGDTASAKTQWAAAVGFGKEVSGWAHKMLGMLALDEKNFAEAKKHFEQMIQFGGALGAWGHMGLGDMAVGEKEVNSAKAHYQSALGAGGLPAAWACLNLGRLALIENNTAEAKKQFQQTFLFSKKSEVAAWAYKNLGDIAGQEKDLEGAKRFYQQAVNCGGKPGETASIILKGLHTGSQESK